MKKVLTTCVLGGFALALVPFLLATAAGVSLTSGSAGAAGAADVGVQEAGCTSRGLEFSGLPADNGSVRYVAATDVCGAGAGGRSGPELRGLEAMSYAEAQIGTPYEWGGELAGSGFDCSGLAQASWRAAGVSIPRVAQSQYDAGPLVEPGVTLEPGDLVFFGGGAEDVTHVGIVVDPAGEMVDAPHTGALVRLDQFPIISGRSWGGEVFVGATRPGGAQ